MRHPNELQKLVKGLIITQEQQKKGDRLYLISMCGVLTPVRSSSPVSFSRNFLLAFKVKSQVKARHMGREVQGDADVGRWTAVLRKMVLRCSSSVLNAAAAGTGTS